MTALRPWRRTRWVEGAAGHRVEIDAAAPRTAASYGRSAERDSAAKWRKAGYVVTLSHLSRGAADFIAASASEVVQVQVKATTSETGIAAAVQAAARDVERMPAGARRVGVVYLRGRGEVARIELGSDGFSASGVRAAVASAALARRRG